MFDLPWHLVTLLNILGVGLMHYSLAWLSSKIPLTKFKEGPLAFGVFQWEEGGELWNRIFKVRSWKKKLPDGAAFFKGGFSKKRLKSRDSNYLNDFLLETRRAEFCHWLCLFFSPIFFLYNPLGAALIMLCYCLLANLPCILAQRVNRPWIERILRKS